ncbi:hypothetical protein EMIHUDRAFT_258626 [Emiliania huxleyi CCMP1516]|uniref:Uncharacterized protein n=2 Tax=Emiliania huxleyi TaxID=2903 RepID=A0A0D3I818_EMIH1|nr:hypothetical protein EMIHUDRAFT_258626 [Emiliania huxleyi CCMP1516]EOD07403.1 hypothetical protein EMIHUDRAFT_258626 [Emiliania huxleyi CCMP1516]|eukprot:XP_005759832.1 hypothetical protein EMIHUDRAFT_258626 [Emiliania huxleyi CCMP1516]
MRYAPAPAAYCSATSVVLSDLGRTIGRLRGFSASFPRTGHELDSHSKKIRLPADAQPPAELPNPPG